MGVVMGDLLRIGVVGCGEWGPNHIRNFRAIEGCVVPRCADISPERRDAMMHVYPRIDVAADPQAVIAAADIDAVVVSTPTRMHYELAKAALKAGKHVLCEKPLTVLSAESAELIDLAERAGRILMVGHVFMFNPGVLYLKEQIINGALGRMYYLDAVRTNLGPIRTGIGAIHDLASHDISIFNFLLGAEPLTVSACGGHYTRSEHEDVGFLTLDYPDRTICHAHVSWLNPRKVRQLTVVADRKMAVWDDMQPMEPVRLYDKGVQESPYYDSFGQFQLMLRDADITIPKIRMFEPLARQAQHFVECVRTGRRPISDGRNGLAVVRALEAARESLRQHGRAIAVGS
jgi:predicted dehydrogenase